jgi:hypothetical protein
MGMPQHKCPPEFHKNFIKFQLVKPDKPLIDIFSTHKTSKALRSNAVYAIRFTENFAAKVVKDFCISGIDIKNVPFPFSRNFELNFFSGYFFSFSRRKPIRLRFGSGGVIHPVRDRNRFNLFLK